MTSFDDFTDPNRADNPLSPRMLQDYQSLYLDLYQERRARTQTEDEPIDEDVVFGKRDSLVVEFEQHPPGKAVDGREMKVPYHSASYDFRLAPVREPALA